MHNCKGDVEGQRVGVGGMEGVDDCWGVAKIIVTRGESRVGVQPEIKQIWCRERQFCQRELVVVFRAYKEEIMSIWVTVPTHQL